MSTYMNLRNIAADSAYDIHVESTCTVQLTNYLIVITHSNYAGETKISSI